MRNKQFVFRGEQLTKDAYERALQHEKTGSFQALENLKKEFDELMSTKAFHKYADIMNAPGATGNHIHNSKNVLNSFGIYGSEDMKHVIRGLSGSHDVQDVYGVAGGELLYDCVAVSFDTYRCAFSFLCNTSMANIRYCTLCLSSENLFGCIGLRKKNYCILNKQYSEEEYHALTQKLIKHMADMPYIDSQSRTYAYGEFFPLEFSPHTYNESVAFDFFPITKESAGAQGYAWKEKEVRDYGITLQAEQVPDLITDAPDSVSKETLGCAHKTQCDHQCTTAFRVTSGDILFYRQLNLPLPRLCPNCRHYERLAKREPVALWHRQCMCDRTEH